MKKIITLFLLMISASSLKLQAKINKTQNELLEISNKVESYIKSNRKIYYILKEDQYFKFDINNYEHIFYYSLYSYINCSLFYNYKVEINGMFNFYASSLVL